MELNFIDLSFVNRPSFSGYKSDIKNSKYIVFGVPYDATTSYRPGTRDGPAAIREASLNIESYSYFSKKDMIEVRIHDLGDIILTGSQQNKLSQISVILKQILLWNKIPVMLGGEHSISIPVRDHINTNTLFIIIDAHGDLREEYLDNTYSHACITKRWLDVIKPEQIIQIGIRGQSLEEFEFLETNPELLQLSSYDIHQNGLKWGISILKEKIQTFDQIYVSVDIDGFDPAYAPGTGTPEPMGLSPFQVFNFIHQIPQSKIVGMDLVEVNPGYDSSGITSVLAAKTLFELLLTS